MGQDLSKTHQQLQYERSYQSTVVDFGMPDRKIVDGQNLENKNILSLGCGIGNDVWYLTPNNTVVGMDYATSGLKVCQKHNMSGINANLNIYRALPFKDKSFDVIICKDILEHLLEPIDILHETVRVLKDDGYLVISVPNHFYLPFRLRILFGKGLIWKSIGRDQSDEYDEWNYMHIRFFTFKGFKRLLFEANLQPLKWFWDFGTLAHYNNPDMWLEPQLWKLKRGDPISPRGKLGLKIIKPLWEILNIVIPRSFRGALVSLAPGLLCAGFYVKVKKIDHDIISAT